jgi:hypothetical protein
MTWLEADPSIQYNRHPALKNTVEFLHDPQVLPCRLRAETTSLRPPLIIEPRVRDWGLHSNRVQGNHAMCPLFEMVDRVLHLHDVIRCFLKK